MSAPAPAARRLLAQTRFEAGIILGNGEQLLLTFVLPVLALFAVVHLPWIPLAVPAGHERVDVAVPGVLAVAIVSTAFTGQAIATAFDRRHAVLRLLGTTPLGREGLLAGRGSAVLAVVLVQSVVVGLIGLGLGWRPTPAGSMSGPIAGLAAALLIGVLGCWAFLSLGLLLGGTVRAEGVLAIANLVWVLSVGAGGALLPTSGAHAGVVAALPSGALGDGLRAALLTGAVDWRSVAVLLVWAVLLSLAARRWFAWD